MLFQFSLTSGLVGGVEIDAAFVFNHLHENWKAKSDTFPEQLSDKVRTTNE